MSDKRNPHPFTRNKEETSFLLIESLEPLKMSVVPAQKEESKSDTHASSIKKRSVYSDDTSAPKDSLDLKLWALYDHSTDFLSCKKDVVLQRKTVRDPKEMPEEEQQEPEKEPCRLQKYETPHNILSAQGFSRKPDGGFYSYIGPEK